MKGYLWWSGGLLIAVVVLVIFAGGLYGKHVLCERFLELHGYPSAAPESTATEIVPDWHIQADCHGVQNSLYLSYYFIALGVALIGAGFIRR